MGVNIITKHLQVCNSLVIWNVQLMRPDFELFTKDFLFRHQNFKQVNVLETLDKRIAMIAMTITALLSTYLQVSIVVAGQP